MAPQANNILEFDLAELLFNDAAQAISVPVGFVSSLRRARTGDEVLSVVARWLPAIVPATRSSVTLTSTEKYLRVFALEGNTAIPLTKLVPIEGTLVGQVYASAKVMICNDMRGSTLGDLVMLSEGGLASCLDVPLVEAGRTLGTINVANAEPGSYSFDEALVMSHIAEMVAEELAMRHELEEAHQLAAVDPLTGAANRRAFTERGDQRVDSWRSQRSSFALGIIDLDHFKTLNDTYGHAAGDEVLKMVVECLLANTRSDDLVARIGGEEFAVLISHSDLEGASRIFERIRASISALKVDFGDGDVNLTASVGLTVSRSEDLSLSDLMQRADQALYNAKANGRNQVSVAPEERV